MIVAPVKPGHEDALRQAVHEAASKPPKVAFFAFAAMRGVHFCRFVLLPAGTAPDGAICPLTLIFSTCYDPPFDSHLEELIANGETALRSLLPHCAGCDDNPSREQLRAILRANSKTPNTFYVGVHGRSMPQILGERALRDCIEKYLDSFDSAALKKTEPRQLREDIQSHVRSQQATLGWTGRPDAADGLLASLWDRRGLIALLAAVLIPIIIVGVILGAIPVLGFLIAIVGAWVLLLRVHEIQDHKNFHFLGEAPGDDKAAIDEGIKALANREDLSINNQFSSLSYLKPGLFRRCMLWVVLTAINIAARYITPYDTKNQGRLSGIPTIHFARWIMVDNGRRLFFESNYTGSWERYLGDFVDKAAPGLTAVWSNTVGFPHSTFLVGDGATDEQPFKRVARVSQIETQIWYSAYPDLTVKNVLNNREIHRGLFAKLDDAALAAWLRRL